MQSETAVAQTVEIQSARSVRNDAERAAALANLSNLQIAVRIRLIRYYGSSFQTLLSAPLLPMPSDQQDQVFNARPICAAITKRGRPCCRPAGTGTDHPGRGPCYLHGGGPLVLKIGRYSTLEDEEFRTRVAEFKDDPDPLNLLEDVGLLRAFLVDMIDNWHGIFGPDGCLTEWFRAVKEGKDATIPHPKFPDFASISSTVAKVGDLVEKIRRQQARTAIPIDEHDVTITNIVSSVSIVLKQVNVDKEIEDKIIQLLQEQIRRIDEAADEAGDRQIEGDQLRGTALPPAGKLPN